jgi:hypothetical protein
VITRACARDEAPPAGAGAILDVVCENVQGAEGSNTSSNSPIFFKPARVQHPRDKQTALFRAFQELTELRVS